MVPRPSPLPSSACLVGKNGKMHRSGFETLKLQSRIMRALLAMIVLQRLGIGAGETVFHRLATVGGFDQHEPPGLAMSDRRRVAGEFEQRVHQSGIDGIAAKSADIATPQDRVRGTPRETPHRTGGDDGFGVSVMRPLHRSHGKTCPWSSPAAHPVRAPRRPKHRVQSTSGSPTAETVLA